MLSLSLQVKPMFTYFLSQMLLIFGFITKTEEPCFSFIFPVHSNLKFKEFDFSLQLAELAGSSSASQ